MRDRDCWTRVVPCRPWVDLCRSRGLGRILGGGLDRSTHGGRRSPVAKIIFRTENFEFLQGMIMITFLKLP